MSAPVRAPAFFFPSPAGSSGTLTAAQTMFAAAGLAANPVYDVSGQCRIKGALFSSVAPGVAQVQLSVDGTNWDRIVTLTADPNNLLNYPFDLNVFGYSKIMFVVTDAGAGSTVRFESWFYPDGHGPDVLGASSPPAPPNPALLTATYRVEFDGLAAAGSGQFLEVRNPGASGRVLRVTLQYMNKPGATVKWTAIKQSALSTLGTATTPTPVPLDSNDGATVGVVKLYTVVPTPGASVGNVFYGLMAGGDVLADNPGSNTGLTKPIVLRPGQSVAWSTDVAASVNGVVEFTDAAA